jgi:hypothetical protein
MLPHRSESKPPRFSPICSSTFFEMSPRLAVHRATAFCCSRQPFVCRRFRAVTFGGREAKEEAKEPRAENKGAFKFSSFQPRTSQAWKTSKTETSNTSNRVTFPGNLPKEDVLSIAPEQQTTRNPNKIDTTRRPDPDLEAELRPYSRTAEQRGKGRFIWCEYD